MSEQARWTRRGKRVAPALSEDFSNDLKELDCDLGSNKEKPTTMEELVQTLRESRFFGGWSDRTDIGDTRDVARQLRERAETREGQ